MDRKSSSSLTLPPCGHGSEMMEAMRRQQELVVQLRALVLPLLHGVDHTLADVAVQLFDDVMGCNISVASMLEAECLLMTRTTTRSARSGGPAVVELVDDKSLVVRNSSNDSTTRGRGGDRTEEQGKPNSVGQKRRRNDKRSRSLVTHAPHYDGHQWRKYGQKNINGRQHPRSYYRCAYRERNCLATKTIEQQKVNEEGTSSSRAMASEENAKYTVVYYGDHTCKDHTISTVQPVNRDLQNAEMAQITADAQQEPDIDLDLPSLLEVYDNSLINWDDWKM